MLRNAGMFDPCDTIYIWSCGTENRTRHSTGSHFWKIVYHLLYVNCTFCKFDTLNSNDDWWSHWNVIQSKVHVIHLVWSLSNNDDRDGNENGENAKGFRSTKQFCMCNCAFLYISVPVVAQQENDFRIFSERKIRQHFTNWKWWDKRNGVWNNVNENLFFQVTVLLRSPSWLLKLPNISVSLLNNRSKATKDSERRWTELRQYMEPDNHISVPGPSEDSIYKKPSIKVCPHFLLYKPFSSCLALPYFALLYFKFLINAKIRRIKDKSNSIKLLGIIFFVFFTRYMYVH